MTIIPTDILSISPLRVVLSVMMLCCIAMTSVHAADYAGATTNEATDINDTIDLFVQEGSNYIKIEPHHLPATIYYLPDSAFGPIPSAVLVAGDTLAAALQLADCQMQWQWEVAESAEAKVIEIAAKENARIVVYPYVCHTTYSDTIAVVCGGMEWGGEWRAQTGDYTLTYTNAGGCDSLRTLHLTVNNPTSSDTAAVVCGGMEWGGEWRAQTGDYTLTYTNAGGCDSVRTLHLTVNNAQPTDTAATAWDTFAWYGKTYAQTGDYTVEKIDANGCDYTHTLHLTIHTTSVQYEHVNACDSMEVKGEMITTSGEWLMDTIYTDDGNRVLNYLVVTMGETYYGTSTLTACNQYESASGKIFTESGIYTDTVPQFDGCEAIITLHLTVENCNGSGDDDEAIEDILVHQQADKIVENGHIYILRKEEKYTILGNKIQ